MVTTDTLISKINALASSIGNVIKTKLSKTEAATIYETKNSLKALAYKDTIAPTDLTDDTIAILKGEKGKWEHTDEIASTLRYIFENK